MAYLAKLKADEERMAKMLKGMEEQAAAQNALLYGEPGTSTILDIAAGNDSLAAAATTAPDQSASAFDTTPADDGEMDDDGASVASAPDQAVPPKHKQRRRKRGLKGHRKREREERLEAERLAAAEEAQANQSIEGKLEAKDQEIRQLKEQLQAKVRAERERDEDRRSHKQRLRVWKAREELAAAEADLRQEPQTLWDSVHAPRGPGANAYASGGGHARARGRDRQVSAGSSYGRSAQQYPLPRFDSSMPLNTSAPQASTSGTQQTTNQAYARPQAQMRGSNNSYTDPTNRHPTVYDPRQPNNANQFRSSPVQQGSVDAQRQPNRSNTRVPQATASSTSRDPHSSQAPAPSDGRRGMSRAGRGVSDFDAGRWIKEDRNKKAGW